MIVVVVASAPAALVEAQSGAPGPPENFYGTATTGSGEPLPAGTEIFALIDGEVQDSIVLSEPGQYGEEGPFGDKLTVNTGSGDEVEFRVGAPTGPQAVESPYSLNESDGDGVTELNLTFGEARLSVTSLSAPSTVTEGANFSVSATITNTGDVAGSSDVEFRVGDDVAATQSVELDPGNSTTVTFAQQSLDSSGTTTLTHGVFTADSNETAEITVQPATSVTFDDQMILENTSEVSVTSAQFGDGNDGDFVVVVHQVASDGSIGAKIGESAILSSGTQSGITVDLQALDGGINNLTESQELVAMLHVANTSSGNNANHGAPIVRDGAPVTDRGFVTVQEPASLSVTDVDVSDTQPLVGENVTLTATVANAGDVAGDLTVNFTADGAVVATEQVTDLAGGANTTVSTTVSFDQAGSATAGANGQTVDLTVQEPASVSVTAVEVSDTQPLVGENVTLTATVENAGDITGDITVNFTAGGESFATRTVEVSGDSTRTVSVTTSFDQAGTVEVGANGVTTTVDVQAPANLQLTGIDVASNVSYGATFDLTATVENTGDLSGSETLTFEGDVDGDGTVETLGTRSVEVAGGATETVTFQFQFDTDNGENHVGAEFNSTTLVGTAVDLSVAAADETRSASVTVEAPDAIGGDGKALDPDNDGIYEDVNGEDGAGINDVIVLFNNREAANQAAPGAFDLTGDGIVDAADVQFLFEEVTA